MGIFKKFFLTLSSIFILSIGLLSLTLGYSYLSHAENALYESNRSFVDFIGHQIEVGYFSSEWPYEALNELTQREGFIFWWIIKEDGRVYRADNPDFIGNDAFAQFPEMREHQYCEDDEIIVNKSKNYAIYSRILKLGSNQWKFWLGFSLNSVSKILNSIITSVAVLSVCNIIILTVFLFFMIKKFTRPISDLLEGTKKISKGNLEGTIKIDTKDELGNLAESFNKMTHGLKKARLSIEREKAKVETMLSDLGEGVVAVDLKGNMLIINKEAEKMFGKKLKEYSKKPFLEQVKLINKRGREIKMDSYPISTCIKNKKAVSDKLLFSKGAGTPIPLSVTVSPIIFQEKIIGIVGTFRDITEEEKIDRAKTEFVSLASHQLQTPLTAIRWFLEILMYKEKLTKRQLGYAEKAFVSNQRMIKLVEDFLNISRLESGIISVYPREGDFVDFVKDIIEEVSPIAKKKKQKIVFSPAKKKIKGKFDPNLISQILLNLFSNAIHYSPEGGRIDIDLTQRGSRLIIKVKDNGVGISKQDQQKLFTKFFRTKESYTLSATGSGLGLYIIRKILDVYKGEIKCESTENKGATFIVNIPIKAALVKKRKQLIRKGAN